MSKFHLRCSCLLCKTATTAQSLNNHINKCTAEPKRKCECCNKGTNNQRFCSDSCRAKVVNQTRIRKKKLKPNKKDKFEVTLERFWLGLISDRNTLRKCIKRTTGYQCTLCNVVDWNQRPLTLIVDHIDGDAGNNNPNNLRLLCPNCNSQTDTFGGRNKGKGRKARGLPLH